MFTESQARERVCPLFTIALSRTNAPAAMPIDDRCIASRCMMWRCEPGAAEQVQARRRKVEGAQWEVWGWDPRKIETDYHEDYEFRDMPPEEQRGWCGLAGAP